MASLAAMLKQMGYRTSGSDSGVYPPMSTFLEEQNISFFSGFDPVHLDAMPDLIVVGNVISRGNVEIEEILNRQLPYISLPDALREFCIRGHRSIVVTGTHGKTSTSALIAWIFNCAGRDPSFLIGGIPNNFMRGFQVGKGEDIILEGDEYDSAYFDKVAKFLRYIPDIGIINNIEFDHADIYNSLEEIKIAFGRFVNLIPSKGFLISCFDSEIVREVSAHAFCPVQSFGLSKEAFWRAEEILTNANGIQFEVIREGEKLGNIEIELFGYHNIRNVLAAIACASHVGIPFSDQQRALLGFRGVKRRLEFKGTSRGVQVYEDFGHHPTAIKETLEAFRSKFPHERIWAIFEPRTATTRRSVFQKEFVEAFIVADCVLIAPVDRPEKAPKGQVFSSEQLAEDLRRRKKIAGAYSSVDEIVDYLDKTLQKEDVVITFSNGPFGGIHQKILVTLGAVG